MQVAATEAVVTTSRLKMTGSRLQTKESQLQHQQKDNIRHEETPKSNYNPNSNKQESQQSAGVADASPAIKKQDKNPDNNIDKKIDNYEKKINKLDKQIEKTKGKTSAIKVNNSKLIHDEATGTSKREVTYTKEKALQHEARWNRQRSNTMLANSASYVTGKVSNYAHAKVSEVENSSGNEGVRAAHAVQKGTTKVIKHGRTAYRHMRNQPYRQLNQLTAKQAKLQNKLRYQKLLKENPVKGKSALSRMLQRRAIKRQYAQGFRASKFGKLGIALGIGAAASTAASGDFKGAAKQGANMAVNMKITLIAKKAAAATVKALIIILVKVAPFVLLIVLKLMLLTACMSVLSSMLGGGTGVIIEAFSFQATPEELTRYSIYATRLEAEVDERVVTAVGDISELHEFRFVVHSVSASGFPSFSESSFEATRIEEGRGYPYNEYPVYEFCEEFLEVFINSHIRPLYRAAISHDQMELMSYLTARYEDFSNYNIPSMLQELFSMFVVSDDSTIGIETREKHVEAWHFVLEDFGSYKEICREVDNGSYEDQGSYVDDEWMPDMVWISSWGESCGTE